MQKQQSPIENNRDPAVPIFEHEAVDFNGLIDEIWRRFTVRAREMRRGEREFLVDFPMNQ